jgi:hypothetical protein
LNQFTSIVDKYKAGEITEQQATTEIMNQMQGSGVSIEQLGEMIGYDPNVIRETVGKYMYQPIADQYRSGGITQGDATRQIMGMANRQGFGINDVAQMTGFSPDQVMGAVGQEQFAPIMQAYNSGQMSEADATRQIINMANSQGLNLDQVSQMTGVNPELIRQTAAQYNLAVGQPGVYGLAPAESAINQGVGIAGNLIRGGVDQAGNLLRQGMGQAETTLREGLRIGEGSMRGGIAGAENMFRQGMGQAETTLRAGLDYARGSIQGGVNDARNTIGATQGMVGNLFQGATDQLQPYAQTGTQANQLQAALSGALGPEAQAQAYQQYQESPGVAFAREESERAILRNASALGGLSGGNVRDELSRRAVGTYMQDFGNQFNRIGDVANRGYGAAGQIANLGASQAGIQAGLGQTLGGYEYGAGTNIGQLENAAATNLAGIQSGAFNALGGYEYGTGSNIGALQNAAANNLAGIQSGVFGTMAGLEAGAGNVGAQNALNAQNLLAQYRINTGRDVDAAIGGTAGAMGGLQQGQGAGIADILGTGGSNIAALIQMAQSGDAQSMESLAGLLANLGMSGSGQYSSQPNVQQQPYTFQTTNTMGQLANIASGLSGLYGGIQRPPAPQITPQANTGATVNLGAYGGSYQI